MTHLLLKEQRDILFSRNRAYGEKKPQSSFTVMLARFDKDEERAGCLKKWKMVFPAHNDDDVTRRAREAPAGVGNDVTDAGAGPTRAETSPVHPKPKRISKL